MSEDARKQTTESITFRMPLRSISQLRDESKKKQLSLNTLVNQIIREHLYWHAFPSSGVPDVTVCNVTSSLVHVTVVPLGIEIDSGVKYLPLLGEEAPGTMETVKPPVFGRRSFTEVGF